ncbi:MAG: hypothetical protein ACJAT0_002570 [Nonlabens sp.]|jgi:hypothetical protein
MNGWKIWGTIVAKASADSECFGEKEFVNF